MKNCCTSAILPKSYFRTRYLPSPSPYLLHLMVSTLVTYTIMDTAACTASHQHTLNPYLKKTHFHAHREIEPESG